MKNETSKPAKNEKKKGKKPKHPVASIKWSPNLPIVQADNIISSSAREKNIWGFLPTYEYHDDPIYMRFLMSGEYQKIWLKERDAFSKSMYTSKREILTTDNNLQRKCVQRYYGYKKPTKFLWLESRCRDLSKLSKDEIFLNKIRETRFKVKEECPQKNQDKSQKKSQKKEEKDQCTCGKTS